MLTQLSGKAYILLCDGKHLAQQRVFKVKTCDANIRGQISIKLMTRFSQLVHHIQRQAHSLSHIAHSTLPVHLRYSSHYPCPMSSILLIDILYNLLSALMLKIHVNIRWLIAGIAHKAGKEQSKLSRIYRCDTQTVAYHRIGSRASPLTQNAPLQGKAYQIIHSKKIRSILFTLNKVEFHYKTLLHLLRHLCAKALPGTLPGKQTQLFYRAAPLAHNLFGIDILQFV